MQDLVILAGIIGLAWWVSRPRYVDETFLAALARESETSLPVTGLLAEFSGDYPEETHAIRQRSREFDERLTYARSKIQASDAWILRIETLAILHALLDGVTGAIHALRMTTQPRFDDRLTFYAQSVENIGSQLILRETRRLNAPGYWPRKTQL